MSLILSAVVASGVLSSKLLLLAGFHSLRLRYPIAVLVSYGVFLGLVRVWLWYVSIRRGVANRAWDIGSGFSWGGGGGRAVEFGGGSSGGAGASDSWGEAGSSEFVAVPTPVPTSGGGGGWFPSLDFDVDDDGIWVLILLAVLILGIVGAGGYLVYAAPQILPEAAWQFALAGALKKASTEDDDWMPGVLRSSATPFIVVQILATALGWAAHHACPAATKFLQVFNCPAKSTLIQ
jgi:hypothetical protein